MEITRLDVWTMAIGALVNASCALLGCYMVLRRLSLLGDAIAHAILPGLAIAFMITGSRALLPMFLGALVVGMLTAFLAETIHKVARVKHDAALGVVFTSLFALGVVLITRVADQVDLDPGCVLYGAIELLPLDTVTHFGVTAPLRFWSLLIVFALVIAFVVILWKELKIVSFDPHLATTMGISAALIHYMLMGVVAGTTVAAFEAVGSILVVAMLVAPAAAAHLLTDRLWVMMLLAGVQGVTAAVFGTLLAIHFNTSVAGMMAVAAGLQFALAVVAAPRYGLVARWLRRTSLAYRIVCEDALGILYRWREMSAGSATSGLSSREIALALGGGLAPRLALWLLRWQRLVQPVEARIVLTPRGSDRAKDLVRSHRLWESYLAKHLQLPSDHLHEPAERVEHFITEPLREQVAEDIVGAATDPHGSPIPQEESP